MNGIEHLSCSKKMTTGLRERTDSYLYRVGKKKKIRNGGDGPPPSKPTSFVIVKSRERSDRLEQKSR